MNAIERELRDALALLDGVPVAGRENRVAVSRAEAKILAVANAMAKIEERKEAQSHDQADDGQGSRTDGGVRAEHEKRAEQAGAQS